MWQGVEGPCGLVVRVGGTQTDGANSGDQVAGEAVSPRLQHARCEVMAVADPRKLAPAGATL
jgi:hypothetical protein